MRRSQTWHSTLSLLLLLTFGAFACKPGPTPAPPPPAAVIPSTGAPIAPSLPAPTITLRADTLTVTRGGSVTLTWDARNAATVDIQPGIGPVTPVASGTRQVSPTASLTYIATATGPGGSISDNVRITVNDPPPPPPTTAPAPNRGGTGITTAPPAPNLSSQQLFDRDMQPIDFDYDMSDIRDDQKGKLQTASAYLKANPGVRITIEGHADERGSDDYNLALGDRRANAVKQYLITLGIADNRFSTVSYGEERPVCTVQTEECFARNRRAAFKN